jgi:hypothetical protein
MRQMFEFVSNVGQQVAKTLNQQIKSGGESTFEMKDLARKFTVDVSRGLVELSIFKLRFHSSRQSQPALSELKSIASKIQPMISTGSQPKWQTSVHL